MEGSESPARMVSLPTPDSRGWEKVSLANLPQPLHTGGGRGLHGFTAVAPLKLSLVRCRAVPMVVSTASPPWPH